MRWYDGLLLGCLVGFLLIAAFITLIVQIHDLEPTPVPYVEPTVLLT